MTECSLKITYLKFHSNLPGANVLNGTLNETNILDFVKLQETLYAVITTNIFELITSANQIIVHCCCNAINFCPKSSQ